MKLSVKELITVSIGIIMILLLISGIDLVKNMRMSEKSNDTVVEKKVYEAISPVPYKSYTEVYKISNRIDNIKGKKIGIIANEKKASSTMAQVIKKEFEKNYDVKVSIMTNELSVYLGSPDISENFIQWINGVDGVILLVGDCVSSSRLLTQNATYLEGKGIPTVSIFNQEFKNIVTTTKDDELMPALRVLYENIEVECTKKDKIEKKVKSMIPTIYDNLTLDNPDESANTLYKERNTEKTIEGTYEEVELYFYQHGWSDGLPIVVPTKEAINKMLRGTDKKPNEKIGNISEAGKCITVKTVAINAVMAGCRTVDFPVVLAAAEAIFDEKSGYYDNITSYSSCVPLITVAGTIEETIELNNGSNAYGSGNSSTATIGRAINLLLKNVCVANGHPLSYGTYGNTSEYASVIGEYNTGKEGLFNWENVSEQANIDYKENVVSVTFENAFRYYSIDSVDGNSIANELYNAAAKLDSYNTTFVITSKMASMMDDAGFTSKSLLSNLFVRINENNPQIKMGDVALVVVKSDDCDGFMVITNTFGVGERIFCNIELPEDWNSLIGEDSYNKYAIAASDSDNAFVRAYDAKNEGNTILYYTDNTIDIKNYYMKGETDGLPVIVASDYKINDMLRLSGYKENDIIAKYGKVKITARNVAINAVMAGCLPSYFPIVVNGIKNLFEDEETVKVLAKNNGESLVWSITGEIVKELNANNCEGILGSSNKANATIGRAINFVLLNCMQVRNYSTYGNSAQYSVVISEYIEEEDEVVDARELLKESEEGIEDIIEKKEEKPKNPYPASNNSMSYSFCEASIYCSMPGVTCDDFIGGIEEEVIKNAKAYTKILITRAQAEVIGEKYKTEKELCERLCSISEAKVVDIQVVESKNVTGFQLLTSNIVTNSKEKEIKTPKGFKKLIAEDVSYIHVCDLHPETIEVVKNPDRITYIANCDTFDPTGMKVKAYYKNGAVETVDNDDIILAHTQIIPLSQSAININYKGALSSVPINVIPRVCSQLIISKYPDKMNYKSGEEFDSTGIEITARFNSGHTMVLDSKSYTIVTPEKLTKKNHTITIAYAETKVELSVSVDNAKIYNKEEIINITNFSAEIVDDKVVLNTNVLGDEEYEYKYFMTDLNWNLCTPSIDSEGNVMKFDSYFNNKDEILYALEWYNRLFKDRKDYRVLCDFSKSHKFTFRNKLGSSKYFFVTVKDKYGNTAIAAAMINVGSHTEFTVDNDPDTVTIKVRQYEGSDKAPYIYAWIDGGKHLTEDFPGQKMEKDPVLGGNWYTIDIKSYSQVFNCLLATEDSTMQTCDIKGLNGDTWITINQPILSKETSCITTMANVPGNALREVTVHIKAYNNNSPIPSIYAWKGAGEWLLGTWPGTAATKDIDRGDNWYYVKFVPDGNYKFIVTSANGEQTYDSLYYDSDVWIVMTRRKLNQFCPCYRVYANEEDVVDNNDIFVKLPLECNDLPSFYIRTTETQTDISMDQIEDDFTIEMDRYYELKGNWFLSKGSNNSKYQFMLYNRTKKHRSELMSAEAGSLEIIVNSFDEDAVGEDEYAYSDIQVISAE